jgi:ribosome-associated protein
MIQITDLIKIEESELQYDFVRASGPGGQNVNKVASAVQLRFDIWNSPSLAQAVKERLVQIAGSRVSNEGILIIEANRYRTQEQNRQDAFQRLVRSIGLAARPPKQRKKTRPTRLSKERRLEGKRRRGEIKRLRREKPSSDE